MALHQGLCRRVQVGAHHFVDEALLRGLQLGGRAVTVPLLKTMLAEESTDA